MRLKLAYSLFLFSLSKAIPGLIAIAAVPLFLREAGSDNYANYGQAWVIATAVSGVSSGWLRQGELRWTGKEEWTLGAVPPVARRATAALAGLITIFAVAALGMSTIEVLCSGALAVAQSNYGLGLAHAQRRRMLTRFNTAEIGRSFLGVLIGLVLIRLIPDAGSAPLILGLAVGYAGLTFAIPIPRIDFNSQVALSFFRFGWPLALWLGASMASLYLDRIILPVLAPDAPIGEYVAASDVLVRGASLLGAPFILLLHPAIMQRANAGLHHQSRRIITQFTIVGIAISLLASALALAWGGDLLRLVGVHQVDNTTLALLILGGCLWQVGQISQKTWEIAMKTKWMLAALILCIGVQLLIICALAPSYGVVGAASATAIGPALYIVLLWSFRPPPISPQSLKVIP